MKVLLLAQSADSGFLLQLKWDLESDALCPDELGQSAGGWEAQQMSTLGRSK